MSQYSGKMEHNHETAWTENYSATECSMQTTENDASLEHTKN